MVNRLKNRAGVTLVELMITMIILGIGVMAAVGSFQFISTSLQNSKARTLSNNLAQEQIEKLKNLSYYMLLVTTSTQSYPGLTGVQYDTGNYPPAVLVEGGVSFTRATRVDFAYQNGTVITTAPWTANDTGLKLITTYVIWRDENGLQQQSLRNLVANPAANPLNGRFSGTVRDTGGNPLAGALVQVIDNPNWFGATNSAGFYQFNVSQGSYTLTCSTQGYFPSTTAGYLSISSNESFTQDFTLGKMSSGTALGSAYIANHLVISQVVGSTMNVATGFYQEYVEVFNPSSYTWTIAANATTPVIDLKFRRQGGSLETITMMYNTLTILPGRYYLFANTGTVSAVGVTRNADAVFSVSNSGYPNLIDIASDPGNNAAGVGLAFTSGGAWIDRVGWTKGVTNPPIYEGTPIPQTIGLEDDEQFVRRTSTDGVVATYGRAYDANDNANDFDVTGRAPMVFPPRNSSDVGTIVSGTPATGAYITFNDPLSQTGICNAATTATGLSICTYSVPNIATGTWTMIVSSSTYYKEISNVVITPNVSTAVPNAVTSPAWPVSGLNTTILTETTSYAFISGVVTNASNNPLAGIIVAAGGRTSATGTNGRYFISVPAGDVQIIANYNNANRAYTSQSKPNTGVLAAAAGLIYDDPSTTWFTLSLGGILVGYFQTGSLTPLPGRVGNALAGGNVSGTGVSGSDGHFYINNLTTGTYTVSPALDPAETASPASVSVTLSSTGTLTTVSTFTITSGLSEITGQVTLLSSSATIRTGVLVVASTATLTGGSTSPPPTQDGWNGMLCDPCFYAGSSDSSGVYSLNVRSSVTSYKVYGWYTTFSGQTPTVTRKGPYAVNVSTAGQIIPLNISW